MSTDISDSDWRTFRKLHPIALERFSEKAIAAIERKLRGKKPDLERFWDVSELVKRQEKQIRDLFDDMRRSTALFMIATIRHHGFLTDEEMSRFSNETQAKVKTILKISTG